MNYFNANLQRMPRILGIMLTVTLIILIISAVLLNAYTSKGFETTKIGVVGNQDDAYVNIALSLLQENGSFEIISTSKENALRLLKEDKIQGYAQLPDNFVSSAIKGKNVPFTYTVLERPSSLYHVVTKETVSSVSVILTESQNGVYGMRQYLKDTSQKQLLNEKSEELSFKYVKNILQRKNLFDTTTVGVANQVSLQGYYFVSAIIVFALILGTSVSSFMVKAHMGLPSVLKSRGLSSFKQVACELMPFFISIYAIVFSILFVLDFFTNASLTLLALKLLPSVLLIASLQFFIYEASSSLVGGTLGVFFSSLCLAFLSGCFYPYYLFPHALRETANLLPIGAAFSLGRSLLSENGCVKELLLVLIWTLIFIILSCAVRSIRIEKEGL